jgi:hypothetical protein
VNTHVTVRPGLTGCGLFSLKSLFEGSLEIGPEVAPGEKVHDKRYGNP